MWAKTVRTRVQKSGRSGTSGHRLDEVVPRVVSVAAAIAVVGPLAGLAPARAAPLIPSTPPPCANRVAYGPVTIDHGDGVMVKLTWNGQSAEPTPAGATLYLADGSPAQVDEDGKPVGHGSRHGGLFSDYHSDQTGTAFGGIKGNTMDLTVVWDSLKPVSSNHYTGTLDASGFATGTDTNSGNGITTTWHMEAAFPCGG